MQLKKKVIICEVGMRDGLQNEKANLTTNQKLKLIDEIADAGFKVIEVGSFVSPKAVPQMADTDELFKRIKKREGIEYRALIANKKGIERAIECGCKKVKLNVSASRAHNLANLNSTPEDTVSKFKEIVKLAKENNIEISGSISMPFGSPWERKIPIEDIKLIVEAYLSCGINQISLSDASGMAVPNQVYNICKEMKETYPEVNWVLHFHNTRGLGISNILAAMQAGMDCFDTSLGGLGGCPFVPGAAGNVVSEDLIHMLDEMDIETGIDIDRVIESARNLQELVGHNIDSFLLKAGKSSALIKELPKGQGKNEIVNK